MEYLDVEGIKNAFKNHLMEKAGFDETEAKIAVSDFPDPYENCYLREEYAGPEFVDEDYEKYATWTDFSMMFEKIPAFCFYTLYRAEDIKNHKVGEYMAAKKLYIVDDLDDYDFPPLRNKMIDEDDYYVLVESSGDGEFIMNLVWGDLDEIAESIIDICNTAISNVSDDEDLEELEEEYCCDFKKYYDLEDCEEITVEQIKNFYFQLSECTIRVECIVKSYKELVKAFNSFSRKTGSVFSGYKLVPEIKETDDVLSEIAQEFEDLSYDYCCEDSKYLIPVDEDEE